MQYTTNFSLRKPQLLEPASVADLNANADSIDTLLYQNRRFSCTEYDQNSQYAPDDPAKLYLCIHENLMYRCISPTSGNWDSTKWERTNLAIEVQRAMASGGTEVEANPSGGTSVGDLTSIKIAGAKYDVPSGGGGGSSTLAGLDDVSLTTPTQGQALIYDGADWVNGKGGSDLIVNAQIYSTVEKQIGIWIDSKPLYQKTVLIDNISSTIGIQRFAHGISNIETVIAINGTWLNKSDSTIYIGTKDIVRPDSPTDNTGVWADATNIVMSTGVNRSNQKLYITIQYTKTTDTPGSGGYSAYGLAPVIYSTEEREIGVYTDGKPLYQKTIYHNTPITGTGVNAIWQDANADTIVWYEGIFGDGNNLEYGIPYYFNSNEWCRFIIDTQQIWVTGKGICFQKGNNQVVSYVKLTVQYTKTTDTPGSGTWTPQGVPAVRYSTDEQVVGTWVDGRTVYEKTLYLASGQINVSTTLALPTQNDIERLITYEGSVYEVNDQRYYAIPYERISAVEGIWLQCHVLSDHTLAPTLFTRQSQTYSLADIYITIRYTKTTD